MRIEQWLVNLILITHTELTCRQVTKVLTLHCWHQELLELTLFNHTVTKLTQKLIIQLLFWIAGTEKALHLLHHV
ncbi:hypothetical protein D3C72_943630 [compost metagenome]